MRLGFDAAVLGHPSSGLQQLAHNLLEAMVGEDPSLSCVLSYVGLRDGLERFSHLAGPRVAVRTLAVPPRWARFKDYLNYLAGGLLAGPVDVFFTPNYHLPPITLAKRRVVMAADLSVLVHPEFFTRPGRWFVRKLRLSAAQADAVVTISEFSRQEIHRHLGVALDKIHVVPCACHRRFHRSLEAGERGAVLERLGLRFPYLLSVGTLQPRKNYVRLIEAFAGLPSRDDLHLCVVGGRGWKDGEILERASRPDVATRVHLLTDVPDEDLPAVYQGATAFCMPSVYEGFGIPLLEAMASGVPVACAATSSLPEVVGDAAAMFDPLDVAAMRGTLEQVAFDEDCRRRLIEAGRERVLQFTWESAAARLLALFRGLLDRRPG